LRPHAGDEQTACDRSAHFEDILLESCSTRRFEFRNRTIDNVQTKKRSRFPAALEDAGSHQRLILAFGSKLQRVNEWRTGLNQNTAVDANAPPHFPDESTIPSVSGIPIYRCRPAFAKTIHLGTAFRLTSALPLRYPTWVGMVQLKLILNISASSSTGRQSLGTTSCSEGSHGRSRRFSQQICDIGGYAPVLERHNCSRACAC
jgi:hypothetical protein